MFSFLYFTSKLNLDFWLSFLNIHSCAKTRILHFTCNLFQTFYKTTFNIATSFLFYKFHNLWNLIYFLWMCEYFLFLFSFIVFFMSNKINICSSFILFWFNRRHLLFFFLLVYLYLMYVSRQLYKQLLTTIKKTNTDKSHVTRLWSL